MEFHLFGEDDLDAFLRDQREHASTKIAGLSEDALLSADPDQLAARIVEMYRVEPPSIDFADARLREMPHDAITISTRRDRPALPVWICASFSGEPGLLKLRPKSYVHWHPICQIADGRLCVRLRHTDSKANAESELRTIREQSAQQLGFVRANIENHNAQLSERVRREIIERRTAVAARRELLGSLSVPFERVPAPADTFTVPLKPARKEIKLEPARKAPEIAPRISSEAFYEIIQTIHDFGVQTERLPSLYRGKDEEQLRDLLLMLLAGNFKGPVSATGETFNAAGKTDILLRYENTNVFIAECLIWKGPEYFAGKIDQLASYLTWRDTQAALVVFARTKAIGPVIEKAKDTLQRHPRFVRWTKESAEISVAVMRLPGDPTRTIDVALLIFHFPEE